MRFLLAVCVVPLLWAQEPGIDILARVAREADQFAQKIPSAVTEETLDQRTLRAISLQAARADKQTPELHLARTVVSEYTVAPLKDSEAKELVEFRQVVSVDGRAVQSAEKARHALSLGTISAGEDARKRMLEDFAKHGLVDVATDYALILMAFTSVGQRSLKILPSGEERVGGDDAVVYAWTQSTPGGGELSFHGNQSARLPLSGKLWARKSDGLPLRISVWAARTENKRSIRDEATVDYVMSPQGFVAPVSVLHQHIVDGQLKTENMYQYKPFKVFGSDTDIKYSKSPAEKENK
jgi:hypothetical protein